jgi:hypothetical protein
LPVYRQRLFLQRVMDEQRDQFLRKLIRPIVVGAIGDQRSQPIRVVVRAHKVVRRCFGRAVRAIGCVIRMLSERRILLAKGAEYFVG